MLLAAVPASAAPVFGVVFTEPTGVVGPNDTIFVNVEVTNTGGSASAFYWSVLSGTAGDFLGQYSLDASTTDLDSFNGTVLDPAATSGPLNVFSLVPTPGPVTDGTYTLGSVSLTFCSDVGLTDCSSLVAVSNTFERTVDSTPEPASLSLAALGIGLLVCFRRRLPGLRS